MPPCRNLSKIPQASSRRGAVDQAAMIRPPRKRLSVRGFFATVNLSPSSQVALPSRDPGITRRCVLRDSRRVKATRCLSYEYEASQAVVTLRESINSSGSRPLNTPPDTVDSPELGGASARCIVGNCLSGATDAAGSSSRFRSRCAAANSLSRYRELIRSRRASSA
jgi:hypothetical protein